MRVTEGATIRRIGHLRWLRNVAVARGNAPWSTDNPAALTNRLGQNTMLDEHILWALVQQKAKRHKYKADNRKGWCVRLKRATTRWLTDNIVLLFTLTVTLNCG